MFRSETGGSRRFSGYSRCPSPALFRFGVPQLSAGVYFDFSKISFRSVGRRAIFRIRFPGNPKLPERSWKSPVFSRVGCILKNAGEISRSASMALGQIAFETASRFLFLRNLSSRMRAVRGKVLPVRRGYSLSRANPRASSGVAKLLGHVKSREP